MSFDKDKELRKLRDDLENLQPKMAIRKLINILIGDDGVKKLKTT